MSKQNGDETWDSDMERCEFVKELLLKRTVKLIQLPWTKKGTPQDEGTGFLIDFGGGRWRLLSAAHCLCNGEKWAIEPTLVQDEHGNRLYPLRSYAEVFEYPEERSLVYKLPSADLLENGTETQIYDESRHADVAFVELEAAELQATGPNAEKPQYFPLEPTLFPPTEDDVFCTAAWTQSVKPPGKNVVERSRVVEPGLEFRGLEGDRRCIFEPTDNHQSKAMYKGASGAPIVDSDLNLVSIVTGGSEERGVIWGPALHQLCDLDRFDYAEG